MARILYGVAGEGMGHAIRSKAIIEHLKTKHDVKIVAASKAYSYLSRSFEAIEIDYFKILYRNNRVSTFLTIANNLLRFPSILWRSLRISREIKQFKPDLIITDFEPLSDYLAYFKKIPVISIDNQHLITQADHEAIIGKQRFAFFGAKLIINSFIIKKNATFIVAIVPAQSSEEHFYIIDPILRKEILAARPSKKEHILVYQTSTSNNDLIPTLQKFSGQKFILYGLGEKKRSKNLTFKKSAENEFIRDLASAKAVITNGGFTLISEAIHLKKPILTIPVQNHFEQYMNAMHVHMSGFGMYEKEINEYVLSQFLDHLPEYESYLKKNRKYSNKKAFDLLEKEIRRLARK